MAQHDYVISNDTGANVRADINNVLQAILTNNSGATQPSATQAGMFWGDTSNASTYYLKIRNHTNDGWVSLYAYDVATKTISPANTPSGHISSTTMQGAINELDSEKVAKITSTANKLVKFSDTSSTITNSVIYDDGTNVGIGTNSPNYKAEVYTDSNGSVTNTLGLINSGDSVAGSGVRLWMSGSSATTRGAYIESVCQSTGNNHDIIFATNASSSSPVERMRIDSAGNVGIGTSSPVVKLDVVGSSARTRWNLSNAYSYQVITNPSDSAYLDSHVDALSHIWKISNTERMRIDSSGNVGIGVTPSAWASGFKAININGGNIMSSNNTQLYTGSNCYFSNGSTENYRANGAATRFIQADGLHKWLTAPSGTAGNAITFTTAMTLDASGNLLVGQTSTGVLDSSSFSLQGVGGSSALVINHKTGVASGDKYIYFDYAGNIIGSITQNGTTAVAYNTTSDHRLKENVRPADALRFNDIEFVDFEWVDGRHDCGVIAHQLQSIYPDLVIGEKDATEMRKIEISPKVEAVYETVVVTPAKEAVLDEDGNIIEEAIAEVTEQILVSEGIEAVYEEQEFPVYQQVNYIGLISRIGTVVQQQTKLINDLKARIKALEVK